jgi:hypothetical protein
MNRRQALKLAESVFKGGKAHQRGSRLLTGW